MRTPQKNRNNRNKNGRNKPVGNVQNRVFESSGPEGKVRGTPQQIIEKYLILARDAQTSGDRVVAENFLQHAEHYIRLLNASQPQGDERRHMTLQNGRADFADSGDGDDADDSADLGRQEGVEPADAPGQPLEAGAAQASPPSRVEAQHDAGSADHDRRDESRGTDGRRQRRQSAGGSEGQSERPAASGLETIETTEEPDGGLVATPESRAEDDAPKKAEPRRRRRRSTTVDTATVEAQADLVTADVVPIEQKPG
jgi:hypothetical protein